MRTHWGVWSGLAVLTTLSSACSGNDATGPRPTAVIVQDTGEVDCSTELPDCHLRKISIVDVRVDGDRIGVMVLQAGAQTMVLWLSDDGGATWRNAGVGGDLVFNFGWGGGRLQLALQDGRAWAIIQTEEEIGTDGNFVTRIRISEWDLAAGLLTPYNDEVFGPGILEVNPDGRGTIPVDDSDPRGGPALRAMQSYDFATQTRGEYHRLCEGGACYNTWWYSPDGGYEWQAFGSIPTFGGVTGQACRYLYRYRVNNGGVGPYGELHCAPYSDFPGAGVVGGPDSMPLFPTGGGALHLVAAEGARAVARTITGEEVSDGIDLGPGKPLTSFGFSGRPRFGGFVPVTRPSRAGDDNTLVGLRDGLGAEVDVPSYPCDAPCGDDRMRTNYGTLVWLEPLGGDDYLAFWQVDVDSGDVRHEILYAERVTARYGEIRDTEPLPEDPPIPGMPNVREAKELIGACAKANLCGFDTFDHCLVSYGSNDLHHPANRRPARDALIAASANGCAGIEEVWPFAGCFDACFATGGVCDDNGGCRYGDPEPATFCDGRAVGYYCSAGRMIACDANGLESVNADCENAGVPCVEPTPGQARCDVGSNCAQACDGDVSTYCYAYDDCGDFGQVCSANGCVNGDPAPPDAACRWGNDVSICAGDYVLHCVGDWRYYTSCTELGFSGCADAPGGASCVP